MKNKYVAPNEKNISAAINRHCNGVYPKPEFDDLENPDKSLMRLKGFFFANREKINSSGDDFAQQHGFDSYYKLRTYAYSEPDYEKNSDYTKFVDSVCAEYGL